MNDGNSKYKSGLDVLKHYRSLTAGDVPISSDFLFIYHGLFRNKDDADGMTALIRKGGDLSRDYFAEKDDAVAAFSAFALALYQAGGGTTRTTLEFRDDDDVPQA